MDDALTYQIKFSSTPPDPADPDTPSAATSCSSS
jgi:hypothetical protein